jgi:predicted P-loop ATPase
VLTDALQKRAWFAINETFHFLPTRELYYDVVGDQARAKSFHPVLNYLAGLRWDGTPRLDRWLVTYGGAEDTPYVRAVGALPLMAAVRRVRQPGCKFDEMLVLENSKQGTNKSTALSTLCPNPDWFSDDLALGLDSQEVIERTGGKWLIEAAELKGIRQSEAEKLKNFLSRCADGPVRRAWGRISEERLRQFIFVGTTNSGSYLRDSTGNRRYWPVRVGVFDVVNLRRDRDQLWAEAAVRESAPGETIRLPEELWGAATCEQEARRQDDAWEEPLLDAIGDTEVVPSKLIWDVLAAYGASPRNTNHGARVSDIMERNGFVKPRGGVRRVEGKPTRCWVRANSPLLSDVDDGPVADVRPDFVRRVTEG